MYCNQCGRRLELQGEGDWPGLGMEEAAASAESVAAAPAVYRGLEAERKRGERTKRSRTEERGGRLAAALLPVIVLFLSAGGVFAYYIYESGINNDVRQLHVKAQQEGLDGHYQEALRLLELASAKRPEYGALLDDAAAVREAIKAEEELRAVNGLIGKRSFGDAQLRLEQLRSKLHLRSEPLFGKLNEQLETASVSLAVEQAAVQLESLHTLDELVAKWQEVKGMTGEQAERLQAKLSEKIVTVSGEEASRLLEKKRFSDAIAAVEAGLERDPGNKALTSLKQQIAVAKEKFEEAEQRRIEDAMQMAAAEDLRNHTAAVEVERIERKLDDEGRLSLTGHLVNAATRPIYTVKIRFTVYSAEGDTLATGEADATPNYVEPGEAMTFKWTLEKVKRTDVEVVVDHATWYLD